MSYLENFTIKTSDMAHMLRQCLTIQPGRPQDLVPAFQHWLEEEETILGGLMEVRMLDPDQNVFDMAGEKRETAFKTLLKLESKEMEGIYYNYTSFLGSYSSNLFIHSGKIYN